MKSKAYEKYMERHAEPEARLVREQLGRIRGVGHWEALVAIPLCRESRLTPGLLDALEQAAAGTSGRVLAVFVINGREDAGSETHDDNARTRTLLDERSERKAVLEQSPPIELTKGRGFDWLMVDRSVAGHRFPSDQGVGLARKIACDCAVALIGSVVDQPWIRCTDGDARPSADYFHDPDGFGHIDDVAAFTWPFYHAPPEDRPELTEADDVGFKSLRDYERYLRYYVAGLQHAGSSYAFHTIGSLVVCRTDAYVKVRGFPRRDAAEDFYLLNKLAKVGRIRTPAAAPLRLVHRPSDRVPFGTGRSVADISNLYRRGDPYRVYHPASFDLLRAWLETLERFPHHRSTEELRRECDQRIDSLDISVSGEAFLALAESFNLFEGVEKAVGLSPEPDEAARHVRNWFDGFRTMKLLNGIKSRLIEPVDVEELPTLVARHPWIETHQRLA